MLNSHMSVVVLWLSCLSGKHTNVYNETGTHGWLSVNFACSAGVSGSLAPEPYDLEWAAALAPRTGVTMCSEWPCAR